jgi:hypothetical protein
MPVCNNPPHVFRYASSIRARIGTSESSRQLATGADQAPERPRKPAIGIQDINQMIIIINAGRRSTGRRRRGRRVRCWKRGGENASVSAHTNMVAKQWPKKGKALVCRRVDQSGT